MFRLTPDAMQVMIKMCRLRQPEETCGFIVADSENPDLGVRVHWMNNVHAEPHTNYAMSDDDVILAMNDFDANGENPIGVFHSHPLTPPVLSNVDLREAKDTSLVYLVVSLAEPKASVRAYRVERFIGEAVASPLPISVVAVPTAPPLFSGPLALSVGNYVRIQYKRQNKTSISTNVARVVAVDDECVRLDPDHKTAAKLIPLERIKSVHVITESMSGRTARAQLRAHASRARGYLAGGDIGPLPEILATLAKAFPVGIAVTMGEQL